MPELPEVETVVRKARPRLEGRTILAFETRWAKNALPSPKAILSAAGNRRITAVSRRAKFILLHLEHAGLLSIHLRMSGRLEFGSPGQPEPAHVRAVFALDDETRMFFCDARKFGRIEALSGLSEIEAGLGPEPLDRGFTARRLGELLRARRRQLKPLLLDQSFIAGLGNIYADEALHRARLHPLRNSATLRTPQVAALHEAIRTVLAEAIQRSGTSFDWIYPEGTMQDHLSAYGRTGQPCRRCGATIIALRVGQRGTHICPRCQPPPGTPARRPLR